MRLSRFILLLPGALLPQCAPAHSVAAAPSAIIQKTPEAQVHNRAMLRDTVAQFAARGQDTFSFRLQGAMRQQWKTALDEALWGEYARSCSARVVEETGQVTLTLKYRDYVRLCAALRHPELMAALHIELTAAESRILKELETRTKAVLRPGMSTFDKVVALHDYLVETARYDATAGGDIADILEKGCGSCEAYSSMLCVMLQIAGIPSRIVTGEADEPHAWNLVLIDGEWYHVDATWDDPVIGDGSRQELSHAYCGVSDAEMAATHSWNRMNYPASGTRRAFYYQQKKIYFTSFNAYWRGAMAAYKRGETRFEGFLTNYGSPQTFQKNLQLHATADSPRSLRWTGPDSASGVVIVSFE